MAYQKTRDPLFDAETRDMLWRRANEAIGFLLIALGGMLAMAMLSYTPQDPSWMNASDAEVQNWLGKSGAMIAAPMHILLGISIWSFIVLLLVWGARFMLHCHQKRLVRRLAAMPMFILFASIHASTMAVPDSWQHSYYMGGATGDLALGVVLTLLSFSPEMAFKISALMSLAACVGFGALALGFVWRDCRVAYGMGVAGMATIFVALRRKIHQLRTRSPLPDMPEPDLSRDAAASSKQRILGGLVRRSEPVPVAADAHDFNVLEEDDVEPSEDRIRSRIASAIRARASGTQVGSGRAEPRLSAGDAPAVPASLTAAIMKKRRGIQPLVATTDPRVDATGFGYDQAVDVADNRSDFEPNYPPEHAGGQFSSQDQASAPDHVDEPSPFKTAPMMQPDTTGTQGAPVSASRVQHSRPEPVAMVEAESETVQRKAAPVPDGNGHNGFETPPLDLLKSSDGVERHVLSDAALEENARLLEAVLDDYGVRGEIVSVRPGPVVTMYELEPAPGLKTSRVIGLAEDIARSMSALSARVSTVPGRSVIGIELPNDHREMVLLREMLAAREFGDGAQALPLALGKDIGGEPVVANLAKMPHLLIAGTTGSGKSVAINTMILSLLYKLSPEDCRLIMIDPKMLELSVYDGIPHLLSPVVTDPKKAVVALKWVVGEMEERYRKMSKMGVRNIDGYNARVKHALSRGEMFERTVQTGFCEETGDPIFETEYMQPEKIPYIVVIVDEMADLMMVAGKEIEACIQRLAQMARASGIHIIMATQRPSVDVITGIIKSNFPTRISFSVTTKIDSRTILSEQGAEQLLGMGDMLYMAGGGKITRVHGPFVSDEEVEEVVTYLKQFGPPDYKSGVVEGSLDDKEDSIDAVLGLGGNTNGEDSLYDKAIQIVAKDRKCSTSYIQRKLAIGYNKAARLVERMEDEGIVSAANHVGKRDILIPESQ